MSADVGALLDDGAFSTVQKCAAALAALAILMDGFDGQLVGFAIPVLIKEWGITRGDFVPALVAGLAGMGIGSAGAGLMADRFGRRWAVIASVLLFGVTSSLIGLSPNLLVLGVLRFVAGLGIGGALPTATTATAEFTPARSRTVAITATILCVPLGGMLAGVFAGFVLPAFGWRGLFLLGGLFPIALAAVLVVALPESPRFLSRRPARWPDLVRLLRRMGRAVAPDTAFVDRVEQAGEGRRGVAALFASGRAGDTVAVWSAFFLCLLAVYSAFSWLPAMLVAEGLNVAVAGSGLTAYNFGGVVGALICAVAITRYGSRWPLLICCAGAAASAFALRGLDTAQSTGWLIAGFGLHGLFVNAVQSTMYAVCAHIYPTAIRATGTASALAFGRLGAILSAFAGAGVIAAGGASAYLLLLGTTMLGVMAALACVRRHIPPSGGRGAGLGAPRPAPVR